MPPTIDLTGKVFGKLTVIERGPRRSYPSEARWLCRCECGRTVVVDGSDLRDGSTKSCRCNRRTQTTIAHSRHGAATKGLSSEYVSWFAMRDRCNNPNNRQFRDYGGRGITVCERWNGSFPDFLADMGLKPTRWHTIDRINPDGNYEPGNCRWATRAEQNQTNRRKNSRARQL